jgi:hemerythrin
MAGQIRWKSGYSSGIQVLDASIRSLVDLLNATAFEANGAEHCQDLNEFFE